MKNLTSVSPSIRLFGGVLTLLTTLLNYLLQSLLYYKILKTQKTKSAEKVKGTDFQTSCINFQLEYRSQYILKTNPNENPLPKLGTVGLKIKWNYWEKF